MGSSSPNAVVKIVTVTPRGMMCGTGFFAKQAFDHTGKHLIITNAHVVRDAVSVCLRAPAMHKRDLPVQVRAISTDLDLAVLEISGPSLEVLKSKVGDIPMLTLGNSDDLRSFEGDVRITARGYPGGSEYLLVTTGNYSGTRHIFGKKYLVSAAAINPGNSGGPALIKLDGQEYVVGVNTMKQQGTEGESLLIPSNTILAHLETMLAAKPESPNLNLLHSLGIDATLEEVEALAAKWNEGILGGYKKVRGEFKALSFHQWYDEHKELPGFHGLVTKVYKHLRQGDLEAVRRMRRQGWDAHTCAKCPVQKCDTSLPVQHHVPRLGLMFSNTCGLAREHYATEHTGVIISDVIPGTLMDSAGVRIMDYLTHLEVGGKKMAVDEFGEIDQSPIFDFVDQPGKRMTLHVIREKQPLQLSFTYACEKKPSIRYLTPTEQRFEPTVSAAGIMFQQLRLQHVEQFQLRKYADPHTHNSFKVVCVNVDPRAPAFHTYSIRPGDVVDTLNGETLKSWKDMQLRPINQMRLENGSVVLFRG